MQEGNLQFNFQGAIGGFKFDEQIQDKPTYHGLSHCMKAVDFIVEMEDHYLFVEVKDFSKRTNKHNDEEKKIIDALRFKFRDTLLYRFAEEKLDKPVRYYCLIELDNAQVLYIMKELKRLLPEHGPEERWHRPLAEKCIVMNTRAWNTLLPQYPISDIISRDSDLSST
ncbi:MAG: hypothetical protein Q7J09_03250 [Methanocalculus sp.]|uniref:hypothetical protein n=1 Tax=Methanocalculus sp. TaxID=2004547 RepID=UPI00272516EF|nr:hypothetical protein [Methanocalculus sp.]MDO8840970.1 hypothetical protein [Methanocalculus sp.]MDO9539008.1 hypothetical protein [Methanocalculus sp.]